LLNKTIPETKSLPPHRLTVGIRNLPQNSKKMLRAFFTMAVISLALGVFFASMTAAGRTGLITPESGFVYRMLGMHGVTIFYYWLNFVQAGFVLMLAAVYSGGKDGILLRPVAWLGFLSMLGGMIVSEYSLLTSDTILLYDGNPSLLTDNPSDGTLFFTGYVMLSGGLLLVGISALITALRPRFTGQTDNWSPITFAVVSWSGLLMVAAVAGINAYVPPLLWTMGLREAVVGYEMSWSVLFHNMHYLPLMATVVLWYILMENLTGVKSVFGANFSKVVFAIYMIFVPPTSLYHLFLEPGLAEGVLVVGSLLSLFIAVPTILVFVVIVASLESHARAQGGRGLFGWMKMLPWRNPVMAALGFATLNLSMGGVFSMVLIQSKLAVLLSDTFYVPGYFHFITVGGVSLTFIAMLIYVIPALSGNNVWRPGLLQRLPLTLTIGLALFGIGGIAAGYHGIPRRVFNLGFHIDDVLEHVDPPFIWGTLMGLVGAGSLVMTTVLFIYIYGLFKMLFARNVKNGVDIEDLPLVDWAGTDVGRQSAWVGPLAIAAMVGGMYFFTILSFKILDSVTILSTGGH